MLSTLHIDGGDFKAVDGSIVRYVGVSDFALFKRWLMPSGRTHLVAPRLAEWRAYAKAGGYDGPIVLRVFRYATASNLFGIDPWSYDFKELRLFTQFCAEQGFYVDWTCGDNQIVCPEAGGPKGQQQHLNETCAALASVFCFIETCNEPWKNGIDPTRVQPARWGSYLRDSGLYMEHDDWVRLESAAAFNLDFISYHGRRDESGLYWTKWLIDMFDAADNMLTTFGKPAVHKEPQRCNRTGSPRDAALWFRMGLVTAFCGVTFHSENGRDGDHLSPHEEACCEAFFAGVRGAGLR